MSPKRGRPADPGAAEAAEQAAIDAGYGVLVTRPAKPRIRATLEQVTGPPPPPPGPEPLSREWVLAAGDRAEQVRRFDARVASLMPAWLEQSAVWQAGPEATARREASLRQHQAGIFPDVVVYSSFGSCWTSPAFYQGMIPELGPAHAVSGPARPLH